MKIIHTCCEPVLAEAIDTNESEQLANAFKLLSDPVRLRILSLVANAPGGEMCSCELPAITGRSQPTVSHHLSLLVEAGLMNREQRGKWAWFRVDRDKVAVLRDALELG